MRLVPIAGLQIAVEMHEIKQCSKSIEIECGAEVRSSGERTPEGQTDREKINVIEIEKRRRGKKQREGTKTKIRESFKCMSLYHFRIGASQEIILLLIVARR